MIKKICLAFIILSLTTNTLFANSKIFIAAKVNNEIITNYDIKKEIKYLKILNPNLEQLDNDKIFEIAKNSLINEIIKKKEISKLVDVNQENFLIDDNLRNLVSKLNYKNKDDFERDLKKKNIYSISQIREKINIELYWNEIIFNNYKSEVKIDKKKLIEKIDSLSNRSQKEYLLSEIVFLKKKDETLEALKNQINLSIKEIGFNNTANIYSISASSKLGGKVGWVSENSLSDVILKKIRVVKVGEHTDIIKIANNFLVLKIEEIKENKIKIDKQNELKKLIKIETNKQLNQFSRIYFAKSKINYAINEK
jgi:peptidyl-prolyl cis-trans isomerase SurA